MSSSGCLLPGDFPDVQSVAKLAQPAFVTLRWATAGHIRNDPSPGVC